MQAFTDVPVNCCDCEETFLSASSLLQHFAEHVKIQLAKDKYDRFKLISKRSYRKYILNNNNNEDDSGFIKNENDRNKQSINVLDKRISPCSSPILASSNDNSRQSLNSEKSEVTSSTDSSSLDPQNGNKDDQTEDDVNENGENVYKSPVHKAQKKIADKLMLNSHFKLFDKNNTRQFCVEFNSEKMLINIERLPSVSKNGSIVERNDNRIDVMNNEFDKVDENSLKRKLSTRKQLVPKKIERSSFIKIAPKPKNLPPISYERTNKPKPKKVYECHLCTKSFGWSTDLKRHILVHTGERPFKCTKCDASFTRNFLLQKHVTKIHPNNKDVLEKNKLLEEKVNENLKQLKRKMNKLTKSTVSNNNNNDSVNIHNGKNNTEIGEQSMDEEMIFAESNLDIKEEIDDPLSFKIDSDSQQNYVNGNWVSANNNTITEKLIKLEDSTNVSLVNNGKETDDV